jgi:small-conductance mechanosensitive channel
MSNTTKPTIVFWVIGVLALIWNILGVMAYLAQAYMTDEALSLLPQEDQDFFNNYPAWVTAAFAISVFAGLFGCIALLMRKQVAVWLFTLSLLGVLTQQVYNFFIQDDITLTGPKMIMPLVIIIICFFLMWFAKAQKKNGVIL